MNYGQERKQSADGDPEITDMLPSLGRNYNIITTKLLNDIVGKIDNLHEKTETQMEMVEMEKYKIKYIKYSKKYILDKLDNRLGMTQESISELGD